jgi:GNAT superfamily N-acetyltransferase
MTDVSIARPTPADRAEWERLFRSYLAFYETSLETEAIERTWRELMRDQVMHARIARLDGRVIGIVHFLEHVSTSAADVCYLQDLFTEPEARGRGVAGALIEAVVEESRARGCSRVYWVTHESNATARRLYDRVGVDSGFIRYQISLWARTREPMVRWPHLGV